MLTFYTNIIGVVGGGHRGHDPAGRVVGGLLRQRARSTPRTRTSTSGLFKALLFGIIITHRRLPPGLLRPPRARWASGQATRRTVIISFLTDPGGRLHRHAAVLRHDPLRTCDQAPRRQAGPGRASASRSRRARPSSSSGPSGAGKSVTLKHMVRLLTPDEGAVWVGDDCVSAAARGGPGARSASGSATCSRAGPCCSG